jgi:hypothetical protein
MVRSNRYRISGVDLLDTLENWDSLMNFRIRLIACGGTALTLLNIKESTKELGCMRKAPRRGRGLALLVIADWSRL